MDSIASDGPATDRLSSRLDAELANSKSVVTNAVQAACVHLLSTRGKLLRGRLTISAAQLGSQPDHEGVLDAAFAVELLHLASLAHDDIVDSGTYRRGEPTATATFGRNASGLAGAQLFARAVEVISSCGIAALQEFALVARQLCAGGMTEARDLNYVQRTPSDYRLASELKTASLFATATALGATLAIATPTEVEAVREFGFEFGKAWQIWDDLEDLLVDPTLTGKRADNDLPSGNFTLPVIFAVEESAEVRAIIEVEERSADWNDEAVSAILRTKAVARASDVAEVHAERAERRLRSFENASWLLALLHSSRVRHIELLSGERA